MNDKYLSASRRVKQTPFSRRVNESGVSAYTVYNHTLLATVFESLEADYHHLLEYVQVWDVSCQRQVQLHGPDAQRLAQLMTPRDLRGTRLLQGKYAPLCDEFGGIVNDPIIIKLADDLWWLSIADSDVKLWARGLAWGHQLKVAVTEADIWPLAVQGPLAETLMARLFGDDIRSIGFFRGRMLSFNDQEMLVMRSGWSKQGGFEIYVNHQDLAEPLWDRLFELGADLNVRAGCPNWIERVESGLLSWGCDMDERHNPFQLGLEKYFDLDADIDSISLSALRAMEEKQQSQYLKRIEFDVPIELDDHLLRDQQRVIGEITAAVWSPRLQQQIILAMIDSDWLATNQQLCIDGIPGTINAVFT